MENNPKNQPKEKIQCEFFDICKHKYININQQVKYHCTDIKSLDESYTYCIIRKKVLDILEGS